jgi:hypothetical protein
VAAVHEHEIDLPVERAEVEARRVAVELLDLRRDVAPEVVDPVSLVWISAPLREELEDVLAAPALVPDQRASAWGRSR